MVTRYRHQMEYVYNIVAALHRPVRLESYLEASVVTRYRQQMQVAEVRLESYLEASVVTRYRHQMEYVYNIVAALHRPVRLESYLEASVVTRYRHQMEYVYNIVAALHRPGKTARISKKSDTFPYELFQLIHFPGCNGWNFTKKMSIVLH